MHVLRERLYLTADRSRTVPEGHPDAAFLLGNVGSEIPQDEADRLGLGESRPVEADPRAVQPALDPVSRAQLAAEAERVDEPTAEQRAAADAERAAVKSVPAEPVTEEPGPPPATEAGGKAVGAPPANKAVRPGDTKREARD